MIDHPALVATVNTVFGDVTIVPVDSLGPDDMRITTLKEIHDYVACRPDMTLPIAMAMDDYRRLIGGMASTRVESLISNRHTVYQPCAECGARHVSLDHKQTCMSCGFQPEDCGCKLCDSKAPRLIASFLKAIEEIE